MADLRTEFCGIKSPNPFWLASAPPTDKEYNVVRAYKAGWGGVVWKTLGEDPPIVNTCSRYGALHYNDDKMIGFNNIELITDRPLEVNLQEITQVKRDWMADTGGIRKYGQRRCRCFSQSAEGSRRRRQSDHWRC